MIEGKNFGRFGDYERYSSNKFFNIYIAQKIAEYVTEGYHQYTKIPLIFRQNLPEIGVPLVK